MRSKKTEGSTDYTLHLLREVVVSNNTPCKIADKHPLGARTKIPSEALRAPPPLASRGGFVGGVQLIQIQSYLFTLTSYLKKFPRGSERFSET